MASSTQKPADLDLQCFQKRINLGSAVSAICLGTVKTLIRLYIGRLSYSRTGCLIFGEIN